ncbi:MAG: hypothetical protein M3389_11440, partial [Actinomycetota bacterium]|nr:hypothetical protein [Actinomycetota bacterium]
MKEEIAEFEPDRIAIDSLTALQRIATARSFREYLLGLSFHVSTVSDTIVVLQYVGEEAEIARALAVL